MNLRSHNYSFKFKQGQSMPEAHLPADSDDHFFKTVLPPWEQEKGFEHVPDTVVCMVCEFRKVPEPASERVLKDKFFAHQADPKKPLTPLQERMQSGGPGERV